jgi:hypothetical protein
MSFPDSSPGASDYRICRESVLSEADTAAVRTPRAFNRSSTGETLAVAQAGKVRRGYTRKRLACPALPTILECDVVHEAGSDARTGYRLPRRPPDRASARPSSAMEAARPIPAAASDDSIASRR